MKPVSEILVVEIQSILEASENMGGDKGNYTGGQLSRESDWED